MIETLAEVHLIVVHAVPGFTALPTPTVLLLSEPNASVLLTVEPDELCIHADRTSALVKLVSTGGLTDAFEMNFDSAIAEARSNRKRHARSRAWLVTDAFMRARLVQGTSFELPEFAVSIDSVPEETHEDLERLTDSAVGRVTSSLSIILGESKFSDIKKVAAGKYSLRPGDSRPTYELRMEFHPPTLLISSPADEELIAALKSGIDQLSAAGLETALRLHKDALEKSDNQLRSFVYAWASLEVFVNKVFGECFDSVAVSRLGLEDSGWEGELRSRLTQKEGRELGVEDRFAFLAIWLSRSSAKADTEWFTRVNLARNDLYHRGIVGRRLPSRDVTSLFQKYLALRTKVTHARD